MKDERLLNCYGRERISSRQIDELTGLARGLCADGVLNEAEVRFLHSWLAANAAVTDNALIAQLYSRVTEVLADGVADDSECKELLQVLQDFSGNDVELGEALKSTTLPVCEPPPALEFAGVTYCFTGTFSFGRRPACEEAVFKRGGMCGSLTRRTDVLVIGTYATESWKHSAFGSKILRAAEMRDEGLPIALVTEEHWCSHL